MNKLTKLVERLENIADRLETAAVREKSTKSEINHVNTYQSNCSSMASIETIINGPLQKLANISATISEDVKKQVCICV